MTGQLERRYRRALRWYPHSWRNRNADVAVGTLLDVAEAEGRTRPRTGELVGLAASGVSARLGVLLETRARNAISTIALATGFVFALAYFALGSWAPWSAEHAYLAPYFTSFGPFTNPAVVVFALWSIAVLNAIVGSIRGMRFAAGSVIAASIALPLIQHLTPVEWWGQSTTALAFLGGLGLLVLLGEPARGVRLWSTLGGSLALFAAGYFVLVLNGTVRIGDTGHGSLWADDAALVMLGCVVATVVLGLRRRIVAAQTVLVSALPWAGVLFLLRLAHDRWNTLGALVIVVVLLALGAGASAAFRRMRAPVR